MGDTQPVYFDEPPIPAPCILNAKEFPAMAVCFKLSQRSFIFDTMECKNSASSTVLFTESFAVIPNNGESGENAMKSLSTWSVIPTQLFPNCYACFNGTSQTLQIAVKSSLPSTVLAH